MAAPGPVLEGVELSSANVERAVLQFYQVQDIMVHYSIISINLLPLHPAALRHEPGDNPGDAQVADPGPAVAPGLELLLGPDPPGQEARGPVLRRELSGGQGNSDLQLVDHCRY